LLLLDDVCKDQAKFVLHAELLLVVNGACDCACRSLIKSASGCSVATPLHFLLFCIHSKPKQWCSSPSIDTFSSVINLFSYCSCSPIDCSDWLHYQYISLIHSLLSLTLLILHHQLIYIRFEPLSLA
jgi:hypothetical protein